jgi:hypothetical protein
VDRQGGDEQVEAVQDMQEAFRAMVISDATGTATEEEKAYLRAEGNTEAWRRELLNYLNDLSAEDRVERSNLR